jgi:hypothetical protein
MLLRLLLPFSFLLLSCQPSSPKVVAGGTANIDYFAGIARDIDIAFTVTWGGADYLVDELSPKVVFPQHEGGAEYRLRRWAEQGAGARLQAQVLVPEKRGDRFLYAAGVATVMP